MSRRPRQSVLPASAPLRSRPDAPFGGKALEPAVRAEFEQRFGHDFGHVRVHTDGAAAASARALRARAYTRGGDVTFASGQYAPRSATGRELIAHELAHVVQQSGAAASPNAEARADAAAIAALAGRPVSRAALGGAPLGVQAKPDEPGAAVPADEPGTVAGVDAAAPPSADKTLLSAFATDKHDLTAKHRLLIEAIAFQVWSNLAQEPDATVSIAITGHTDTTGTEEHNSGLGDARAASAKAALESALAKQGVDTAKIEAITVGSKGDTALLVPTADEVDEPQNRRVEIEVTLKLKVRPPPPAPIAPLPGMPGGPKLWEVPGMLESLDEPDLYGPRRPPKAPPSGEWLEGALKRDPLLKKLPKWARDKAIGALKDADEKAADAIIDAIPFDDEYRKAAKAAMKALLQTLKGRKFKPPPEPPRGIPEDMLKTPSFPKMPGEMILKLPAVRF